MYRVEAKRLIAACAILVILGRGFLTLVSYGPLMQDTEFDAAVQWAESIGIWSSEDLIQKPFEYITRAEAAHWYVAFAQSSDMLLYTDDICRFNDIADISQEQENIIMLSCMYRFFRGSKGWYFPDSYLTKSWSLVALMKWFFPTKEYPEVEPYREPFIADAFQMGITQRESDPYMMYLVSRYELLLQLYRAWQWKTWE